MAYIVLFKEIWHYAKGFRWKIVLYFILHILSLVASLLGPWVFGKIIDSLPTDGSKILSSSEADSIIADVFFWIIVMVGLFAWFNICHRFAQYLGFSYGYRVKQNYINEHYKKVTQLNLAWHSNNHSGSTISRINTAASSLHDFSVSQFAYIDYFMKFFGPLLALTLIAWQVSVATVIVAVLSIVVMWKFDQKLAPLYHEINEIDHKVSSTFFDYVSNIRTIITLRLGFRTRTSLDNEIEQGYHPYIKAESVINQWKWLAVSTGMLLLEAGVILFYIALQLRQNNSIQAGVVATVYLYLQQLTGSYRNIARNYQQIIAWRVNSEAVKPITNTFIEAVSPQEQNIECWETVRLSSLNFEYEPGLKTLDDVDFSFDRGENIALVGESGSGKSSLMSVMRGLYTPENVNLRLDTQELTSLAPLKNISTLIPQDPELFENTILFNLTFGIDYADADIHTALEIARFDQVLTRLPNGLETDVREKGVSLSGGEKQRLSLARGILAAQESSIILLDEPTSSVDAENELLIYKKLLSSFKQAAIISSIHRLHLLPLFDRVVVMENGKIVQVGSFKKLVAQPGKLKNLWNQYQTSMIEKVS